MAKMDVSAAKMILAVWNGYVWDARHVHGQWRPVEQALHDRIRLMQRCGSLSSSCQKQIFLSQDAMLSLVVLSVCCTVLPKNC